jgi:hypothetical protein
MGLDMYLSAKKTVSEYDFANENGQLTKKYRPDYANLIKFFPEGVDEMADYKDIDLEIRIGYWRKVNQVHGFFVDKCAGGEDNCQSIWVDPGLLRELRVTCEFLLDEKNSPDILDKIEENLPLAEGFFFGSREIDEYYWLGLEQTIPILNKAIELAEEHECEIYYRASW